MIYEDVKGLARDVWTLAKGVQNIELQTKTLELKQQILELIDESLEKSSRIKELETALAFKDHIVFRDGAYWVDGDATPYCPLCWERDHLAIHLQKYENGYMDCPNCKTGVNKPKVGIGRVIRN